MLTSRVYWNVLGRWVLLIKAEMPMLNKLRIVEIFSWMKKDDQLYNGEAYRCTLNEANYRNI